MSTPVRLLGFGTVLAAVFALSLVGARTLPASPARGDTPSSSHQTRTHIDPEETGMDHTGTDHTGLDHTSLDHTSSTGETETQQGGPSHGRVHSSSPTADRVRGLAVAQDGYQLEALMGPDRVGQDGVLSFRLAAPDGQPVTDYTTSHDKRLHLIVVRSDGSRFRHVHPTTDGAGTWSLPWRWTAAGSYRVFADFVPAATGDPITLTSTVDVAGTLTPVSAGKDSNTATVDGFTVSLAGSVRAGRESGVTFTVTRAGAPVTTLQPYLGAAGHLVALRAGDLAYLHVHPMGQEAATGSGPEIGFLLQPPSPGRYLLYLDFQVDGNVHTATFTTTAGR